MGTHIGKNLLYIFRNDIRSAFQIRMCLCHTHNCQGTSRTDSETDQFMLSGGCGQGSDIFQNGILHMDITHFLLHGNDIFP